MSALEQLASKTILNLSGQIGSRTLKATIDDDKIVVSANMKVGAYTVAAQPTIPCQISVTVTAVGTTDTLGTITIVGKNVKGEAYSETLTPIAGSTVYTTNDFSEVSSVTGAGWVIDAGSGNDTIKVGMGPISAGEGQYFSEIQVVAAAVVASQTELEGFEVADLTKYTSIPAGSYKTKLTHITLTSGEAIGILASR